MAWFDFWLKRGITWTFDLGKQGKALDSDKIHCIDCGVKKKDHYAMAHLFREIE
mgnify:FL=1